MRWTSWYILKYGTFYILHLLDLLRNFIPSSFFVSWNVLLMIWYTLKASFTNWSSENLGIGNSENIFEEKKYWKIKCTMNVFCSMFNDPMHSPIHTECSRLNPTQSTKTYENIYQQCYTYIKKTCLTFLLSKRIARDNKA